jgi:hypothetical protein
MTSTKSDNGSKKPRTGKAKKGGFTPEEWAILAPILAQIPVIRELPVEILNIDMSYQDRPRERIVNQIATEFQEALLGVLKISQRPDGTYWVADGATRVLGILRRDEKHRLVRCEIFQTKGQQAEALLFAWSNSTRSKQPIKLGTNLQAYHVAGTDHGFGKLVEECGYRLTGKGINSLRGPGYVKEAWDLDGNGTVLRKTLYAVKEAWKGLYPIHGNMLLGIALVYVYPYRPVDEQVRRFLQRNPPSKIEEMITRRHVKSGIKTPRIHPGDRPPLIAALIVSEINKNPGRVGKIDFNRLQNAWSAEARP